MTGTRMQPRSRPVPEVSVHSGDLDEAREYGTRIYHRHRVTVLGDATRFAMSLEATALGPLTLGWLTYDTQVRLASAHENHYQINVPTAGTMLAISGGQKVIAGTGTATLYVPDREAVFTGWATPAPMLALRIARRALERELEQLLDRPLRHPIDLDLGMDVASGRGAQWLSMVRSLADDLADESALVRQPMVAAPFTRSIMTGLLMTAQHEHREELASPVAAAGPSVVRTARAFIEANAHKPLTVNDIARAADVGVRGLQQGFQRSLETSPTEYLRQVRLREVHRELLTADAGTTTVGDVAARWGFAHQGRFAVHYRDRYGVRPGETLRRHP
jgi:AraC-like DNA-binding protein